MSRVPRRWPVALLATARAMPRSPVALAVLSFVPVAVVAVRGGDDFGIALSASAVIAGAGLGYAADDPAAPTLESSPTSLAARRTLRVVLVAAMLGAAWAAAALIAQQRGTPPPDISASAAALFATAGISAAFAARARTDAPVTVGANAVVVAVLGVVTISAVATRWPVLPTLADGSNPARWWWVTASGMVIACWSSRDPAASRMDRSN